MRTDALRITLSKISTEGVALVVMGPNVCDHHALGLAETQEMEQNTVNETMILSVVREINDVINNLIDLTSAWADCDFEEAMSKVAISLKRLDTARGEILAWNNHSDQAEYLEQIDEVQSLLNSFEPFLAERASSSA